MKRFLPWLCAIVVAGSLTAATAPMTIELEDGRVLESARILSQSATTVSIACNGGIIQVEKELLPAELRARYPLTAAPVPPAAVVAAEEPMRSIAPPTPALSEPAAPAESVKSPATLPPVAPNPVPVAEPAPAPLPPPPAAAPAPFVAPTVTVTATYVWRDAMGAATPLDGVHGFAVERATFLDWAARRRERYATAGRKLLLEYVGATDQAMRDAARERLEQFVAKSVGEPPAAATRLVVNEYGQFSITAPAGHPFVVVMTATRQEGPHVRSMTWFDLIDGTVDRRISRDALETSVGDWNFGE